MNPIGEVGPGGVLFALGDGPAIEVEHPIAWASLDGARCAGGYDSLKTDRLAANGVCEFACDGARMTIADEWSLGETMRLRRRVHARPGAGAFNFAIETSVDIADPRPLAPGMIYSPTQWRRGETFLFADHRLAYPIVSVWSRTTERLFWLARTRPALRDEQAERVRGAHRYRQRTELGSVGFRIDDRCRLIARWPYAEEDRSAMLGAGRAPAVAFHPLDEGLDIVLEYEFGVLQAEEFSAATRVVVERIVSLAAPDPTQRELAFARPSICVLTPPHERSFRPPPARAASCSVSTRSAATPRRRKPSAPPSLSTRCRGRGTFSNTGSLDGS